MLDLVDEALHQMALSVQVGVILPPAVAVGPGWNHRHRVRVSNHLEEDISVVTLVGQDKSASVSSNQCRPLGDVVTLPSGKLEAQRVAQPIHANVDFGAESASAAAQGLGLLAAPFWGAPAAQG